MSIFDILLKYMYNFKLNMFNSYNHDSFYDNVLYFVTVAVAVFTITFGTLYFFDLVPNSFQSGDIVSTDDVDRNDDDVEQNNLTPTTFPDSLSIPKIGLETTVGKPQTPDFVTLNDYLARGAVYYPGSGSIEQGNMFIFGHSADIYRNVQNQALKVFNGFQKLVPGDSVIVTADGVRYVYKVISVQKVTEDDALVTFDTTKRKLTLSTCDTFGQKQDRIVVEAEFSHEL